jgi:hypothetical protein
VTSNRCIPVKNTLGCSAVMFGVCEIIQLLSVVFCVIWAVHKFDFRFVVNETPNKCRPVEISSFGDRDACF